ncbi:EAL domain-containing protein [Mesorhizobium sp. VNQ89]
MGATPFALRSMLRLTWKPTSVLALLAIIVVVTAWLFAEFQTYRLHQERLRSDVLSHVSLLRAKLEGNVNKNLELVRGFVATLATEPEMTQERFSELADNLLAGRSQIRNIAVAPDLVVTMVHPLEGNRQVIGLDYRNNLAQREAALRARETGELVLAGPVELVQGGLGFIARFPVFVDDGAGGERFWGIVSAVIEAEKLYRDSGLLDEDLPVEVAIIGRDGKGNIGDHFFGPAEIARDNPVMADVVLPAGSWTIAARPNGGWDQTPPNAWTLRLVMLAGGILLLIPALAVGQLIEERLKNVDELRRREMELEGLSRRLSLALDSSQIGVWELNTETNELIWDGRVNQLYGYPPDNGPRDYTHWERAIHPDDLQRVLRDAERANLAGDAFQTQYRLLLPNGEIRHLRESAKAYSDRNGAIRIVGVNWDVTADVTLAESLKRANMMTEARNSELRAAKERIEFNSLHDSLTGLPNRRYVDEMLAEHIAKFETEGERAALLHLDLDRFKQINDTLGHAAGDAMLVHAARVLKANLRHGDFVARVGGDEFIVLCKIEPPDRDRWDDVLASLADRIIEEMHQPVLYQGHECRFGVSIGIACDLDQVADPRRLLVNADLALYRAKSRGRNRYQFFNDALQAEIVTTKRTADDILSGLERNEFVAYYQPQFDATTHAIIGVEALARWKHPSSQLLLPGDFMKIAEELNVVATIDRMILEQSLDDMKKWAREGINVPKASVNVSARRLHDEELIRGLRDLSIRPGSISFELVESIFLDENDDQFTWNVDQIKALGIDIEIDDFGTGYASIVSLLKLKPKRLKIDRQLVTPILTSPTQRHLVGSIIDIGKSLGIEVMAEGVETMEHARVLKSLGCTGLQGHAFAPALSAADFKEFARGRKVRAAS